ncbi:hypothetical protein EON80_05915 [bacterium]|nr:MAG: hypothetical protein EON80_05915 [bacterium]
MEKRPLSVSVIAWILLVTSLLSLAAAVFSLNEPGTRALMARTPLPIPLQHALTFGGLALDIVAALFMLRGANWARLLYIVGGGLCVLLTFAVSPVKALVFPAIIMVAVFVFFLTRPRVSAYFASF